jgi:hypothetical protein
MPYVGGGVFLFLVAAVIWAVTHPEKTEKVAGWIAALVSKIWSRADKAAVAWKVQGDINAARTELLKSVPAGLLEREIKIKWTKGSEAEALLRDGEVLVCLERADHHERNVGNAVMAFLPKTMLPQARRYLDSDRMHAADLIVAKGLLAHRKSKPGTLNLFFRDHLDPARAKSPQLREKIDELDQVDLMGWLSRLLLAEYLQLGEALHPSEPDPEAIREAEELARWVYGLAKREPGDDDMSLTFEGRYFRVAFIFVGIKAKLEEHGAKPYRKAAKSHIYKERFNTIYLMARDDNMSSVTEITDSLKSDGLVEEIDTYVYALRSDFEARYGLKRSHAIIACIRRKRGTDEADLSPGEDLDTPEPGDLPRERYETVPPKIDVPLFDAGDETASVDS